MKTESLHFHEGFLPCDLHGLDVALGQVCSGRCPPASSAPHPRLLSFGNICSRLAVNAMEIDTSLVKKIEALYDVSVRYAVGVRDLVFHVAFPAH
jgi:hypothetical protein